MTWETFKKSYGRKRIGTISIRSNGTIAIAEDVIKQLGSPSHIIFMFDKKRQLIGIKPAEKGDSSYPVRKMTRSVIKVVSSASFLKYFNLEGIEKRPYNVMYENGMATFCIEKN